MKGIGTKYQFIKKFRYLEVYLFLVCEMIFWFRSRNANQNHLQKVILKSKSLKSQKWVKVITTSNQMILNQSQNGWNVRSKPWMYIY